MDNHLFLYSLRVLLFLFVSDISFIFTWQIKEMDMEILDRINRPSKVERKIAAESYDALAAVMALEGEQTEIEIEETKDKITVPLRALKLFGSILKVMSEGKPISIVPSATQVTTQKAAEMLGVSRPYLVKLLEQGAIQHTKVGKHRRILVEDVAAYKEYLKTAQKRQLIDMMEADEELGLYDL